MANSELGHLCYRVSDGSLCFNRDSGSLIYKVATPLGDIIVTFSSDPKEYIEHHHFWVNDGAEEYYDSSVKLNCILFITNGSKLKNLADVQSFSYVISPPDNTYFTIKSDENLENRIILDTGYYHEEVSYDIHSVSVNIQAVQNNVSLSKNISLSLEGAGTKTSNISINVDSSGKLISIGV